MARTRLGEEVNTTPGTAKQPGSQSFTHKLQRPSEFRRIRAVLGVRPGRGFAWTGLLGRTLVVGVTLVVSWILTWLVFGFGTDWGAMYEDSLRPKASADDYATVGGAGYQRSWQGDALQFVVHPAVEGQEQAWAAGEGVVRMWAGKLEELPAVVGNICLEGREDHTGYALGWSFGDDVRKGVEELGGEGAGEDCRVLFAYEPSYGWAPYARDVVQEIPRGALPPLIGMVLAEAVAGGSQVDQPVELGGTVAEGLTRRIAGDMIEELDYALVEKALPLIALMFGPVQFLALGMAFVSVLLLVASLWFWWARDSVDIAMNLIPYIGFFGTLLGMGGALAVLGEADLSDPVSKATSLGPIGSRLALAIETTKWALICYCVVSVLVLVRDSVFKRNELPNERGGIEGLGITARAE